MGKTFMSVGKRVQGILEANKSARNLTNKWMLIVVSAAGCLIYLIGGLDYIWVDVDELLQVCELVGLDQAKVQDLLLG